MIKKIDDLEKALSFILKSYSETIKEEDSKEGQKSFESLYLYGEDTYKSFNINMYMYGYFKNDKLIGIISIDNNNYIKFLFVDSNNLNIGIGTKLLNYIENITKGNLYLDSSISNIDFYLNHGFIKKSDIKEMDEMKYIEMVKYRE